MEHKVTMPDTLVAVECGYKYRFFGRDAEIAGELLGFYVNKGEKDTYASCSFPIARLTVHTNRLANNGYRVAHLAQTETNALRVDSGKSSGPFERGIVGLFSRATLPIINTTNAEVGCEQDDSANYLLIISDRPLSAAERVGTEKVEVSLLCVSLATGGAVRWDCFKDGPLRRELMSRLLHFDPVEIVASSEVTTPTERCLESLGLNRGVTVVAPSQVPGAVRYEAVNPKRFRAQEKMVSGFFAEHPTLLAEATALPEPVLGCMGVLIHQLSVYGLEEYLYTRTASDAAGTVFGRFSGTGHMKLPSETLTSLEIFDVVGVAKKGGGASRVRGSLNWVVNTCRTAFGARRMRQWLSKPLLEKQMILDRQEAVHAMARGEHNGALDRLRRKLLSQTPDLERILAKMSYGRANPKEVHSLLVVVQRLVQDVETSDVVQCLDTLPTMLRRLLSPEHNKALGDLCRETLQLFNAKAAAANKRDELFLTDPLEFEEIKELVHDRDHQHEILNEHLVACRKKLHKYDLEYKTVSTSEYLLDLPNALAAKAPKDWTQVSKVAKSVRFHTPVVKDCIHKLQVSKDLLRKTSDTLFADLQKRFTKGSIQIVQRFVDALAELDCLFALADLARDSDWCMPEIVDDSSRQIVDITDGRHPVIDRILKEDDKFFVPNDVKVSSDESEQILIVTGPNMGGKSSYLRQAALIVLLSQIGSFVPAKAARLSIFDAIFVRLGSHDSLLDGQSSFLVEITETSTILRKATAQSLLVLDEIGRGTSTFDGIAVAHSILEWLISKVGCVTLFVTHYPELLNLADVFRKRIKTCHMAFAEQQSSQDDGGEMADGAAPPAQNVTFLYKIAPGCSPSSFGMNVARLAGIPQPVIDKAATRSQQLQLATAEMQRNSQVFIVFPATYTHPATHHRIPFNLCSPL